MKKSELKQLIKEVISELTASDFEADQLGMGTVKKEDCGYCEEDQLNEIEIEKKLQKIPKYKNNPELAKQAAIQISKLMKAGDKRMTEMWTAWEAKNHVSPSGVVTNMDPSDEDYEINYGKNGLVAKDPKSNAVKLEKEGMELPDLSTAVGPNPNDPTAKKLADASKKIADAKSEQAKLDGKQADIEKRNAPQMKDIERKQQDVAGKLARASDDAKKAEDALTKKVNKI